MSTSEPKEPLAKKVSRHEAGFETPPIDLEEAAQLRPTKLRGKALNFMVTFVAGTGVGVAWSCARGS